jgi:nitrate/nitrite transporter NarK
MTKKPARKPQIEVKDKLTLWVTLMVSATLCISVLAMVIAFMLGLWAKEVDNGEIFKMISPAFSTLIGGMIGFLSGIKLMQNEETKKDDKC